MNSQGNKFLGILGFPLLSWRQRLPLTQTGAFKGKVAKPSWQSITRIFLFSSASILLLSACGGKTITPPREYGFISEQELNDKAREIKKPIVIEKSLYVQRKENKKMLSSVFNELDAYKKETKKEWKGWKKKSKARKKSTVYKRKKVNNLYKRGSVYRNTNDRNISKYYD